MNRAHFLACTTLTLISAAGTAYAQGRGGGGLGVGGGAVGTVTGAAGGTLSNGVGAAETVTETGIAAGARRRHGGLVGGADAATAVRQNAALASSAQPLLPNGANPAAAAAGFEDANQFMTTLHAARNMNIPFDDLKSKTTGKGHVSLEKAARQLRPDLDDTTLKESLKLAEKQSDRDMVHASAPAGKDNVAEKIAANGELSSRISALLPAGSNLKFAAAGFRNEGQFIATAEASHNLNLAFVDLKDRVTAGQSLGEAIHAMKPAMSRSEAQVSAQTAANQANQLRAGRESTRGSVNANADGNVRADRKGASADANVNTNAKVSAKN
jgi:hypothetical protein